jgi:hypothetical protein
MKGGTEYFVDLAEECERLAVAADTTPTESVILWRRAAQAWGEAPLCESSAKRRRTYRNRSLQCLERAVQLAGGEP